MTSVMGESRLFEIGQMSSSVCYRDPPAAMTWLGEAFGFEVAFMVESDDPMTGHIEMACGAGVITVGGEWADWTKSPSRLGGANSQSLKFVLGGADLDAHFRRAVAAGAVVLQAPADQVYLQRTYRVADPEGHVWTFATNLPGTPEGGA